MNASGPAPDVQLINDSDWGQPSNEVLARLIAEIPWQQESITLFGKMHMQPRLICWMGDPGCAYRYSGKRYEPRPWHPLVAQLRARVETIAGVEFNSVLLNQYRDGQDSMGYHADDEPELGERPVIASLSFGAERTMHFRHRHDRTLQTNRLLLTDGSLLIMRSDCQANWKHAIPKTRKPISRRVNLTFRQILM
ncbi:MAG: alpha-ketoglutarate-dependent dioxygenase AlkB [Novosphingobium sp.]|nr:alpha-ketoglutarate-dependent dioxygenase AlkB [Sphingobium sp.]MCB2051494.1 alpha-ketoglutarate-dependent dioxygenase AlkB [Novosphingobium sp.]